jgi:DNA-binding NarL/FixJ family response regulator
MDVTALATQQFGDGARDPVRVVLAVGSGPLAGRVTRALAPWPGLTTRFGPEIQDLLDGERGDHQLVVACCESLSRESLEPFKRLKRVSPQTLIVAVCGSADRRAARRLLDYGIDGLVFADQLEVALAPTVASVFAGQTVVPRNLRGSVERPSLSARERQILGMVVTGLTNQQISARMFLAESTIKSHLSSAYNKLGVCSRSEAVAMILDPHGSLGTGILAAAPNPELRAA